MVNFLQIKRNYKIFSMYPINPHIFSGWPEQTDRYTTYLSLTADSGSIVDKYGNTFTNNNTTVSIVNGVKGMSFNGTSSYLKSTTIPTVSAAAGWWLHVTFKSNINTNFGLAGKTLAGISSNRYGMLGLATNNLATNINGNLPTLFGIALTARTLSFSFKNGTLKTYVDGVLLNTTNNTTYGGDTLVNYWVGCYGNATNSAPNAGYYFNGLIYSVMQGSGEPNAADMLSLYQYQKSRYSL